MVKHVFLLQKIKVNLLKYYSFEWKKIRVSLIFPKVFPDFEVLNSLVPLCPELQRKQKRLGAKAQELQERHVEKEDCDDAVSG